MPVIHQTIVILQTGKAKATTVQAGKHYTVRKAGTLQDGSAWHVPDHVIATRQGDALLLRYADGSSLRLDDFFNVCQDAAICSVHLPGASEAGITLSADSASAATTAADAGTLVYAYGKQDVLMSMAQGQTDLLALFGSLGDSPLLSYLPPTSTAAANAAWASTMGEVAVVPGAAGLLLTAEGWSNVGAAGFTSGFVTLSSVISGVIQAGPVTAGNDLEVTIYAADGSTVLAERVAVDSAGNFSANVGNYVGVVIAKLVNKGSASDYLDEATNASKDLTAVLMAAGVVSSPGTTLTLNLNPLTTLAFNKLGTDRSAAHVEAVNAAVAQAFGLVNLQSTVVVATNSGSYNPADGLSEGEKYGAVLAALSGMDKLHGGNVQTTLDRLSSQLTLDGTSASLSETVKYEIAAGAKTVASLASNAVVTGAFGDEVATLINYSANPVTQAQGLAKIAAYAGAAAGVGVPSAFDYANANVNGIDSSARLQLINDAVHAKTTADVDTSAEVQALADAVSAVFLAASGGTAPTLAQLQLLGLGGITADNLKNLAQAIAATADDGSAVDTLAELQALATTAAAAQAAALAGISTAAQMNNASIATPALATYSDAGITGVSAANLAAINSALNSAAVVGSIVDSVVELQTLVNAYNAIFSGADGSTNLNLSITAAQYASLGVSGASTSTTSLLNSAIDRLSNTAVDDVGKLQSLADAANAILTGAQGGTPPSLAQLQSLGLTGITSDNLAAIQNAIANSADDGSGVATIADLQTLASNAAAAAAAALVALSAAAQADNAGAASPSLAVYTHAGVSGVSSANLASINSALNSASVTGSSVDTRAEVQTLVDTWNAILAEANGSAADATPGVNPSAAQYAAVGASIGAAATDADNLHLLNDLLAAQTMTGADTVAKIDNLARIANAIQLTAAGGTPSPALSADDFSQIGITVLNLPALLAAIAAQDDNGSATDSLSKLQALVSAPLPASPVIDTVSNDNLISASEAAAGFPITGTGELGATVTLSLSSGRVLVAGNTAVVAADGTWSVAVSAADIAAFGQGSELISASQTDTAGNTSATSGTRTISVDTATPVAPVLALGSGVANGASAAEATAGTGVVSVSAETGASTVITFTNGPNTLTKTVTGTGSAQAVVLTGADLITLGDGTISVSTVATDAAGNASAPASASFSLDATAPAPPTIHVVAGDDTVNVGEATAGFAITGTGEIGATISLSLESGITLAGGNTAVVDSNGNWTIAVSANDVTAFGLGSETISASQTDIAGNTSAVPGTRPITVNALALTLVITDDKSAMVNATGGDITYTFTFSEAVTGFDATDVTVAHGSKGAFSGSGTTYTLVVTPSAGFEGNVTVDVASAVAIDAANNPNVAATQNVQAVDTLAPTLVITDDKSGTLSSAGGDITYTFTFSEAVTGFAVGDITVANGVKGTFTAVSATQYTLVVTPNAGFEGNVTVDVAGSVAVDAASNPNTAATQNVQAIDTLAPTLLITDDKTGTLNSAGGDITYTFTFSQAVTGFAIGDITVANGTKGTFTAVSATQYSLVVTPTAGFEGNVTVDVAGAVAIDVASNPNSAATQNMQAVDTLAPTLTITDDKSGTQNSAGGDITYTFTFSEAVTGFVIGDITVVNGTKGTFTAVSATQYTLVVTPTAGFEGNVTIDVAGAVASDAANNPNSAAAQNVQLVDTLAPTLAITDDNSGTLNSAGGDITYTFTFSEAVTGFAVGDITVVNGSKGTFTALSATQYTLVVTPTAGFEGNVTVDVAGAVASDAANNPNSAAAQNVQLVDTLAPTLAITDDKTGTLNSAGGDITYTFTFSQAVTGFAIGDITVANGTKGTFTAVSATQYTLVVTPTAGFEGNVTVDVAGNVAVDAASNPNSAATQNLQVVDTAAPSAPAIGVVTADDTINLVEATAGFAITGTGEIGATISLSLESGTTLSGGNTAIVGSDGNWSIAVSANDVTAFGLGSELISASQTDIAGNASATHDTRTIAVNAVALTVAITDDKSTVVNASDGDITYTFTFSEDVTGFAIGDITVVNGTKGTFTAVSATQYTLVVTPTAGFEGNVTVDVAGAVAIDAASNPNTAATQNVQAVDTLAPTLLITDDKTGTLNSAGGDITYTFTFSEAVTGFAIGDITVANGTKGTFTAVSATQYTLVVTPNAGFEGNVTADVAGAVAVDTAGNPNAAASQNVQAVDTLSPTLLITDDKTGTLNSAGGDITYTFTFSQAVTGFDTTDITLANGTKGAFSGSGTTYTLVVTPNAGFEGNVTVDVAGGVAVDTASNLNTAATQNVQAVDTLAPTLVITDDKSGTLNSAGGDITYTFTFSEAVTGFAVGDITVLNGSKGTFTALSATQYTLVVTPTAGFEGNVTVDVAGSVAVDAASNPNTAATQNVQAVDTLAPTLLITDDKTGTLNSAGGDITYTFTFSQAVTGFAIGDITVANGTKGTFTAVSATQYTLVVTPTAGFEGNVTVDVADSVAVDAASNSNTAAAQNVQAVDTSADLGTALSVSVGDTIISNAEKTAVSYTVAGLDGDATATVTFTDHNGLSVNGSAGLANLSTLADGAINVTISAVDIAGNTATGSGTSLTLDTSAPSASLTTVTLDNTGNATVQSSEVGTAYLVNSTVSVTTLADITNALDGKWNSVPITTANSDTNLALSGLDEGTYNLYTVDAAGNLSLISSSTLTILSAGPTISGVSLSSATGLQNNTLNAGDVLTATVTFSEAVTVSGTPQLALNIGGTTVQANYASGSGSTSLTFTYTILASQTDANGISLDADSLSLNSGSILSTAASTPATLNHIAVGDNGSFLVDTTAPAVPSLALATDSGANDGVTNVSTVNVTGLEGGASWQYQVDSGAWNGGTGSTFALVNDGLQHSYKVRQTDLAGNLGGESSAANFTLDSSAPTATITDGTSGIASGVVTFTFTFNEAVSGFDASDVTLDLGTKGTFTAVSSTVYTLEVTPPEGPGTMHVGVTTGSFNDVAGNVNSVATTADAQLYASVIDLGASGKLIAPANVGGKWYYYWDMNGNGLADEFAVNHNVLDGIFYKSDFVGGAQTPGLDTTDTFHFGTISGWNLSLPTTSDLLQISGATATTAGWGDFPFWSATRFEADIHDIIFPKDPGQNYADGDSANDTAPAVLLQVL